MGRPGSQETGGLRHTLKQHTGPIFSLKFNKEGRYLLTGSVDNTGAAVIAAEFKAGAVLERGVRPSGTE